MTWLLFPGLSASLEPHCGIGKAHDRPPTGGWLIDICAAARMANGMMKIRLRDHLQGKITPFVDFMSRTC